MTNQPFNREAALRSLEELKALQGSEGWKKYAAMMAGQKRGCFVVVTTSNDQTAIVRNAGALGQLEILENWVPAQIAALEKQIKDDIAAKQSLRK